VQILSEKQDRCEIIVCLVRQREEAVLTPLTMRFVKAAFKTQRQLSQMRADLPAWTELERGGGLCTQNLNHFHPPTHFISVLDLNDWSCLCDEAHPFSCRFRTTFDQL